MRFPFVITFALLVALAAPAFAQEDYTEFASKNDQFTITFPGKPTMSEGTWITEYGVVLPAKIYTVDNISGHHVLTVVDYSPLPRILGQKSFENCPLGAETCLGGGDTGIGYWKMDVRGAETYALSTLLVNKPNVTVTHMMYNFMEMVAGQELQFINNTDGSRTSASAYMHANRLIFAVSTTKKGFPEAETMQQSVGWLDTNGKGIRYQHIYDNEPDVPPPPIRGAAPQLNGARPDRIDPAAQPLNQR